MDILNKEELKRQIAEGKDVSLDGILEEFKTLLRETIQTASEVEMTSHLGYEKHQESTNTNYRNGVNKKTLKSKYGDVDVSIPRDRDGTFEPQLVKKRETLLKGSEDLILSLYTKGMSVRDIQHHLDDLYGYQLSEQTISNITSAIIDKAKEWQNRPLEPLYPIIFDVLIFAIDGLNGFNQAIEAVYPKGEVQRCIVHQIRSSLRYVSWKDRKEVAKDLKTVYTAPTEEDAQLALTEFHDIWGKKYPHITQSWTNNWNQLATFFKYPQPVQTLIYTTNPIESLNSSIKRKTKSKGSFPTVDAAFKMLVTIPKK